MAHQELLDLHFNRAATYWDEIYGLPDVYSRIHQQRRFRVLELVRSLGLPGDAKVLDAGCGAGLMAVDLAALGYLVTALDSADAMVDATKAAANKAGVDKRVFALRGDVAATGLTPGTFDLVVSLGVLPWLGDIHRPLREAARLLKPGGHLIVTMDNRWGLHRVLDPRSNPVVVPFKHALAGVTESAGLRTKRPRSRMRSVRTMNSAVQSAGLTLRQSFTLGFGPFTFLNAPLLSDDAGWRLHASIQQRLDRGKCRILRRAGAQHILCAQKSREE